MIDIACLAVVGVVVWCVSSEGIWGAAQTFLCVLLAGLLAMNFFEPLANLLDGTLGGMKSYSDIIGRSSDCSRHLSSACGSELNSFRPHTFN